MVVSETPLVWVSHSKYQEKWYSGPFRREAAEAFAVAIIGRRDLYPQVRILTDEEYRQETGPRLKHTWDVDERDRRVTCRTCGMSVALSTLQAAQTVDPGDCPGKKS
jgi:hypothetical protein